MEQHRTVEIAAPDEAAARAAGASRLGVGPADVAVEALEAGRFRATATRVDAALELALSEDRMSVAVKSYLPPVGAGRALAPDLVRQQLRQAGIAVPPQHEAIGQLIAAVGRGEDPRGLVLARGTEAVPAADARLELFGDHQAPVFPGDVFARRTPPRPAQLGRTVEGKDVRPPGPAGAKNLKLVVKAGARMESDGAIHAEAYGLVRASEDQLGVEPLLVFSADRLEAQVTVFATDFQARPITAERVQTLAATAGVRAELDAAALASALEQAREQGAGVRVSLARGSAAVPGQDGRLELGMVTLAHGTLSVTRVLTVPRDVDYSSGNIHMKQGSVSVKGSVRTGFSVLAGGNIVVGDTVGGALVEAAGDVEVRRGIAMHGKGRVRAGGSIRAHYVENARLSAQGDVYVDNEITNSEVVAGGKVQVTRGRGRIQGGVVRAGHGVEADELGSELETPTLLFVGQESATQTRLEAEVALAQELLHQAQLALGTGDVTARLARAPPSRRRVIEQQLKAREQAQLKLEAATAALEQERLLLASMSGGEVLGRRLIHPGTTVVIAGYRLQVAVPVRGARIHLVVGQRRLAITPLA